jgi:hypothetical protein
VRKVKFTLTAVGDTREEALAYALQGLAHAVADPKATGQHIANAVPSMYFPSAWVNYSIKPHKPKGGKPVAIA